MIDPSPKRVTWYYGEWESTYENLDIPNLYLEKGLPTSFDASKRNIVVLDALMAETDGGLTNRFTRKSHHSNTSVIYLVQYLYSQYIVVFKNPRDVSQLTTLAKQISPGRVKFVRRCDVHSLRIHFGRSETGHPEDLRLRTSILPDDAVQYVYMPKV